MAVFGSLSTVRTQLAFDPRFKAAMDYLAEAQGADSAVRRRLAAVAVFFPVDGLISRAAGPSVLVRQTVGKVPVFPAMPEKQ